MEIIIGVAVVGIVLLVVKATIFLPNKVYLEQVLGALRAMDAHGIAEMLEASVGGRMGTDMAKQAWEGLRESRMSGLPAEECARSMIRDWKNY